VSRQIDEWAFEALKAGGVLADGESTTEPESHIQRRFSILFYFPLKNTQTEPREESQREHTQRSDGGVGAGGFKRRPPAHAVQRGSEQECGAGLTCLDLSQPFVPNLLFTCCCCCRELRRKNANSSFCCAFDFYRVSPSPEISIRLCYTRPFSLSF